MFVYDLSASVSFQRLCIFGLYGAIQMLLLLLSLLLLDILNFLIKYATDATQ